MINLIKINLVKKLNKTTYIYFLLSFSLIIGTLIYYSYDISQFNIKINKSFYINEYVQNNLSLIIFLGVFFSLILSLLELHKNVNNFDAYFISSKGKFKFIIAKLFAFVIIIFLFTLIICLCFSIVLNYKYFYDFKLKMLFYLFGIFLRYFLLSFFFIILTRNIFSIIIPFAIYLLKNISFNDKVSEVTKYLFLDVKFINNDFKFNIDNYIVWIINGMLFIFIIIVYLAKDIKC